MKFMGNLSQNNKKRLSSHGFPRKKGIKDFPPFFYILMFSFFRKGSWSKQSFEGTGFVCLCKHSNRQVDKGKPGYVRTDSNSD